MIDRIPNDYNSVLDLYMTQKAIKNLKDHFQVELSKSLNLLRVTAPLFVLPSSGLNDDLNGIDKPVSFEMKHDYEENAEIVHSLAKWKRYALKRYEFAQGKGLYADMNAIRKDEVTSNIHSIYVDQWDWEKIITKDQRNIEYLKSTVLSIYEVLKESELYIANKYSGITATMPQELYFMTSQELLDMYPTKTDNEREYLITKEKGAVFLMEVGADLSNGKPHDNRAPDYDDWSLNGDLLLYYPVLDIALEISSMGIRVDEHSIITQLEKANASYKLELDYQKSIVNSELPYTIGGGIGQSRLCMFMLKKAHIGEVQVSVWPKHVIDATKEKGITLL